jgi:hypothetical protein
MFVVSTVRFFLVFSFTAAVLADDMMMLNVACSSVTVAGTIHAFFSLLEYLVHSLC